MNSTGSKFLEDWQVCHHARNIQLRYATRRCSVTATVFTLLDVWVKTTVKTWCTKRVRAHFKGKQFLVNGYFRIETSYKLCTSHKSKTSKLSKL